MSEMLAVQFNSIYAIRPLLFGKTNISNVLFTSPLSNKVFKPELLRLNPALENIRSEAGDDFLQYLQWLQLENEPNLLTLSSTHHYYYDYDDLKNIKILINLKPLNRIKHLKHFLRNLVRLLPQKSNFIGCFKNTIQNRSYFSLSKTSDYFSGLINYIDLRTENSLTIKEVSKLLEDNKLNVVDITEINGMTYFCSQTT
jgi:hypothetical protein